MERYYPDTFYAQIYENSIRKDGSYAEYQILTENPTIRILKEGFLSSTTKDELRSVLEEYMHYFTDIDSFECTETEKGWRFTRFVFFDDNFEMVISDATHYTHQEIYDVHLHYYADVYNVMGKLP